MMDPQIRAKRSLYSKVTILDALRIVNDTAASRLMSYELIKVKQIVER